MTKLYGLEYSQEGNVLLVTGYAEFISEDANTFEEKSLGSCGFKARRIGEEWTIPEIFDQQGSDYRASILIKLNTNPEKISKRAERID